MNTFTEKQDSHILLETYTAIGQILHNFEVDGYAAPHTVVEMRALHERIREILDRRRENHGC